LQIIWPNGGEQMPHKMPLPSEEKIIISAAKNRQLATRTLL
jgi:hypothetical protein